MVRSSGYTYRCKMSVREHRFLVLVCLVLILSGSGYAVQYTELWRFTNSTGYNLNPYGNYLTQGIDGNLYGATSAGGNGCGTIFRITPDGVPTVLYSFPLLPHCTTYGNPGLTLGSDGTLYGVGQGGLYGHGMIYTVGLDGTITDIFDFTNDKDSVAPYLPMTLGSDGNLYLLTGGCGVLTKCGGALGHGGVFKFDVVSRKMTIVYSFPKGNSSEGPSPLFVGTDGNYYFTNYYGLFDQITPNGVFTQLASIPYAPQGQLVQAADGSFYGTTGSGALYQVTSSWQVSTLHTFPTGCACGGIIEATDGNFYAVYSPYPTPQNGVVYQVTQDGSFSVVYTFPVANPQYVLHSGPMQHTNGKLYGGTWSYSLQAGGVIYSLDVGAPSFVSLLSGTGVVGTQVGILGTGLSQTTQVTFNGVPATFTVSSDTYIIATVPGGASSGLVQVSTSTGELTSNREFIVH